MVYDGQKSYSVGYRDDLLSWSSVILSLTPETAERTEKEIHVNLFRIQNSLKITVEVKQN